MAEATENKTATAVPTEATTPISKFNTSYLLPHGILKIIEIDLLMNNGGVAIFAFVLNNNNKKKKLFCIAIFSVTSERSYVISHTGSTCGLAVAATFFITTLILLILNVSATLDKIWFAIDITVNVLAVISFVTACSLLLDDGATQWSFTVYYEGLNAYQVSLYRGAAIRIFAAGGLSAIAPLLYILSIVFSVKAQLAANKVTAQA